MVHLFQANNVFTTLTQGCLVLYKQYMCTISNPLCGSGGITCSSQLCSAVVAACNVNVSHTALFDCAAQQTAQSSLCGIFSAAPSWHAGSSVVLLIAAALVALL